MTAGPTLSWSRNRRETQSQANASFPSSTAAHLIGRGSCAIDRILSCYFPVTWIKLDLELEACVHVSDRTANVWEHAAKAGGTQVLLCTVSFLRARLSSAALSIGEVHLYNSALPFLCQWGESVPCSVPRPPAGGPLTRWQKAGISRSWQCDVLATSPAPTSDLVTREATLVKWKIWPKKKEKQRASHGWIIYVS